MAEPAAPPAKRRRWVACCLLALVTPVALLVGLAVYLAPARATQPLDFAPVERDRLGEVLLAGKFKLLELPGRLLEQDAVVGLSERELNLLLFSQAGHTASGEKARIHLEGDELWFLYSKPLERRQGYLNLRLRVFLQLEKGQPPVLLLRDGYVGDYHLGTIGRRIAERMLQEGARKLVADNARLRTSIGIAVAHDQVELRYPPP
ncbi:MAG: hypothetical protein AB7N76_29845 [Planctomycetota bacterium]